MASFNINGKWVKLPDGGFRTHIAGTQAPKCPWREVHLADAWVHRKFALRLEHEPVAVHDPYAFAVHDGTAELGHIPAPLSYWLWREMRRGREVKCALVWVGGTPRLGSRIYLYLDSGEPLRVPKEAIAQCQSPKTRMEWARGGHAEWVTANRRP